MYVFMLSIIIPALNEEEYIPNLLNCLSNQTFKDFEVIVVDANSEDNTKIVTSKFRKQLKIKVLDAKIRNVSYQRNLGLKNAKNEMVLFLDADTIFENAFLENALNEIKTRNLILTGCYVYPDSLNLIDIFFFAGYRVFLRIFYKRIGFNGCCVFTLKSLHKKINGFDETIKVSEDFDYVRRLKKFTKINLLKTVKVKTSVRRFQKNGRLRTGIKILLIGFYTLFFGKITTDIFKYRFNDNIFVKKLNQKDDNSYFGKNLKMANNITKNEKDSEKNYSKNVAKKLWNNKEDDVWDKL